MLSVRMSLAYIVTMIAIATVASAAFASDKAVSLANAYVPSDFMTARAKAYQDSLLILELYKLTKIGRLPGGRAKPGTYSDEDLKHLLNGFDQIRSKLEKPLDQLILSREGEIQEGFLRDFHTRSRGNEAASFFTSKDVLIWTKRNRDFLAATLPLSSFANIIRLFAPEKIGNPTSAEVKELEQVSGGMGQDQYFITTLLRSESLRSLLPIRFDVGKLSEQESTLRKEAKHIFSDSHVVGQRYLVDLSVRAAAKTFERDESNISRKSFAAVSDELSLLASRLSYAADPHLSGACDHYPQRFDVQSIRDSDGDWKRVKDNHGSGINPASDAMQSLAYAYLSGCYGRKDAVSARHTLEQWANSHGDRGKIAYASHCTLAHWARYGIGGKPNEELAREWEARFVHDTGITSGGCRPGQLVDPSDPWRVL